MGCLRLEPVLRLSCNLPAKGQRSLLSVAFIGMEQRGHGLVTGGVAWALHMQRSVLHSGHLLSSSAWGGVSRQPGDWSGGQMILGNFFVENLDYCGSQWYSDKAEDSLHTWVLEVRSAFWELFT